jgi:hypothetical protein
LDVFWSFFQGRTWCLSQTVNRVSIVRFGLLACAGFVAACGGGGNSPLPTVPTAPAQSVNNNVSAVVIDGPRLVPSRSNVTYQAAAILASGNRINAVRPVAWTTDNSEIATIRSASDGYGELAAGRQGTVTITATYQGKSGATTIDVRDTTLVAGGANVEITYVPNPVRGVMTRCSGGFDSSTPTWTFTETIAETAGVGFTQETFTFNLYSPLDAVIYTETEVEKYYYEPNSVYSEEFCTSLFGAPGGFYTDIIEGFDDRGNRMAFGNSRLRLLAVDSPASASVHSWAPSIGALPIPPMGSKVLVRTNRRRLR